MNDLQRLHLQRSMFAWMVTLFADSSPEQRRAVEGVDSTMHYIHALQDHPVAFLSIMIVGNIKALRKLNAALVAMPDTEWTAVSE
jgi:hypothetical protein